MLLFLYHNDMPYKIVREFDLKWKFFILYLTRVDGFYQVLFVWAYFWISKYNICYDSMEPIRIKHMPQQYDKFSEADILDPKKESRQSVVNHVIDNISSSNDWLCWIHGVCNLLYSKPFSIYSFCGGHRPEAWMYFQDRKRKENLKYKVAIVVPQDKRDLKVSLVHWM